MYTANAIFRITTTKTICQSIARHEPCVASRRCLWSDSRCSVAVYILSAAFEDPQIEYIQHIRQMGVFPWNRSYTPQQYTTNTLTGQTIHIYTNKSRYCFRKMRTQNTRWIYLCYVYYFMCAARTGCTGCWARIENRIPIAFRLHRNGSELCIVVD